MMYLSIMVVLEMEIYKHLILTVLVKMALLSLTVMLQAQVAHPLERQL